jgi:hypothetical protein
MSQRKAAFLLALSFLACAAIAAQNATYYTVDASVLIRESTSKAVVSWVESKGGYFTRMASDLLVLRIPAEALPGFQAVLAEASSKLLRYELSSLSLDAEIKAAKARVASSQDILEKVRGLMAEADLSATLALEREISTLIASIEQGKGRISYLENRAKFAEAWVRLEAPAPSAPSGRESSFPWLSRLDFYTFMRRSPL